MQNAKYNSYDIRKCCKNKLSINFNKKGKHYTGWYLLESGIKICRITVPKGRKFIPPGTYKNMARQLKISSDEFDNLLDCSLGKDKYEETIKERNINNF